MINTYNNKIFNYTNYFIFACIIPLGYFAPIGEWLLISLMAIAIIINCLVNNIKFKLSNILFIIISILLLCFSYFWSINPERTLEVIGPVSGILLTIYIVINNTKINQITRIENLIGLPVILTGLLILSDIVLNTEIRSSLAIFAGDEPTSESGNYSRGIIIMTMIMPLSVSLYIHKKQYLLGSSIFILVTLVILLGPNESSKIAMICALIASIIVFFLGPRAFLYFGIISLIYILSLPIISIKVIPSLGAIDKNIYSSIHKKVMPWQATSTGGSIIHRLLVWEFVANEISKKPILGHGAGTSRLIGQNIVLNVPNTNIDIKGAIPLHPHNNFLQIWLELGLLGIFIISFIWIKIIKFGIMIRKNSYVIGTGICTSIITIFIISNLSFGVFQAWWMASIGLMFLLILQSFKYIKI